MCGIIGSLTPYAVSPDRLQAAVNILAHRGPEYLGSWQENIKDYSKLSLGHCRLSILDLSASAHQPYMREEFGLSIVFNGEIYNFKDLKKELLSLGYHFFSEGDTEVVLLAYHAWGEAFLSRLRGMFAFCIVDSKQEKIFAARDRLGKKPFYYFMDHDRFLFSSEIKSLQYLLPEGESPSYSATAVSNYLLLGYIPSPETIYSAIQSLPAAHSLSFPLHALQARTLRSEIEIKRYWRLNYEEKTAEELPLIRERLDVLLDDAVRCRLEASDVPVGAFLSGGIDSSAVVAYASRYVKKLKTFTIRFDSKGFDESHYARKIAEKFQTEHYEFNVVPDLVTLLPKLAFHFDQPFGDSSALPSFYLAQKTKEHVKVVLSGDGGDESFLGYDRYQAVILAEMMQKIPSQLRRVMTLATNRILRSANNSNSRLYLLKRFFNQMMDGDEGNRYRDLVSYFGPSDLKKIYPAFSTSFDFSSALASLPAGTKSVERFVQLDLENYLVDDLLVKTDRTSMAHALEVRCPFLDHKLMEYAAGIPLSLKFKLYQKKYLLKNHVLKGLLPDEVMFRKKMGFGLPVHEWFAGHLYSFVAEHLLEGRSHQEFAFDRTYLEKLLQEHRHNHANHSKKLWSLLMLELWMENHHATIR